MEKVLRSTFDAKPRVEKLDDHDVQATLDRLEALSRVLDSAVKIPGTDVRVGVDALIGMVPVVGDIVSKLISSYLILEARRLGASKWLIARMATNTTVDMIVGAVPVVGDVFDVMYRANEKNIRLLKAHVERHGFSKVAGHGRGHVVEGVASEVRGV